jgi:rod shape-determining protein MreC
VSERRTGWLLVVVLVAQLVILSLQAPAAGAGGNFLESVVLRVLAPLTRAVALATGGVSWVAEGFTRQRRLVAENRELRARVEALELDLTQLRGVEADLEQLASDLDYQVPPGGRPRPADIVYIDHASWLRTLVVYVGDGAVERNQPVVAAAGLVGRVVLVAPPYAKVQLITDRTAAVGAMIERTRRLGVVGSGADGLELDYLPRQADVRPGDRVITSGIDGIYPRGIPVGTVASVEPADELFYRIRLDPAIDFGLLDRVYILSRPPLPEPLRHPGAG